MPSFGLAPGQQTGNAERSTRAGYGSQKLPAGDSIVPCITRTHWLIDLVILIHANYLMLGLMVGAFGLLGNEVMNRRFGQASLLAYSARTLPLTPRYIFTIFVLKDTLYYFFLWIFPLGAGFFIGTPALFCQNGVIREYGQEAGFLLITGRLSR